MYVIRDRSARPASTRFGCSPSLLTLNWWILFFGTHSHPPEPALEIYRSVLSLFTVPEFLGGPCQVLVAYGLMRKGLRGQRSVRTTRERSTFHRTGTSRFYMVALWRRRGELRTVSCGRRGIVSAGLSAFGWASKRCG